MQLWIYDPMAVFFLVSLDCFKFYSEYWLAPCLKKLRYPVCLTFRAQLELLLITHALQRIAGWNPERAYRVIMETSLLMNASNPASLAFLEALADQKLAVVIYETWAHRDFLNRAKKEIWHPSPPSTSTSPYPSVVHATSGNRQPAIILDSLTKGAKRRAKARARQEELETWGPGSRQLNVCLTCRELSDDEKCVRWCEVHKRPDAAKLIGAAMTCVPPEDRLKPLPLVCVFLLLELSLIASVHSPNPRMAV